MDIRNCKRCGKVFAYQRIPICPECEKKDNDDLEVVRQFIADHPGCTIQVISQETEISSSQIRKYLVDGRLDVIESMSPMLECENCGTQIYTGRLCYECSKKLGKEVARGLPQRKAPVAPPPEKKESAVHLSKLRD